MSLDAEVSRIFSGKSQRNPEPKMFYVGRVLNVSGQRATVELPNDQPGFKFGPMPFGRSSTPPIAGDEALVIFAGKGLQDPWLIAWSATATT